MAIDKTKKRSMSKKRKGFIYTLEPKKTKVLILGTFPSEKVLDRAKQYRRKHFYYSTGGNSFWEIIYECIEIKMSKKDFKKLCYDTKIDILSKNSICLWDLINSCSREGSSNKGIKKSSTNDLSAFLKNNVKIIVNGLNSYDDIKKSITNIKDRKTLCKQLCDADFLPQTSSTNSKYSIKDKKRAWKKTINKCKCA